MFDIDRLNKLNAAYGHLWISYPGPGLHDDLDRLDDEAKIDTRGGPDYFDGTTYRCHNPVGRRITLHEKRLASRSKIVEELRSDLPDSDVKYSFWLGADGDVSGK